LSALLYPARFPMRVQVMTHWSHPLKRWRRDEAMSLAGTAIAVIVDHESFSEVLKDTLE
jgi:hypothetical protein